MMIRVRASPNSKKSDIKDQCDNCFSVKIDEPADEGKANRRLIEILSDHFNVPKSSIRITRGLKSKDKMVEISAVKE
ncbi:MAG TPA: DUF167 domain-containing protein [archaeon]|nr:DUF167 domain-containing protein [archaeon]